MLPDVVTIFTVTVTTILVYLSSRAVETSTDDNTCYGIVIMYDKDSLYKVGMRWKSDIALHLSTVTLLVIQIKSKCVFYSQKCVSSDFSSHSQSNNLLSLGNAHTIYGN